MQRVNVKVVSLLASLAVLTGLLSAGTAAAAPIVYLDEPFSESPATWTADWYDADIGARNRVSVVSDGSDGNGIKVSIPTNSHFGSAMHWQFEDQGIPQPDEVFFRYYLRIPDGFTNYGRGKLPGPAGLYSGSARNNIKPTDSQPGWSARMFFSPTYTYRDADYTQLGFYVYHRNQASDNGDLILWDSQPGVLRHGAWYCVEGHAAMNTPGQANGLLEGWVDEKLAFYQEDFKFLGSGDAALAVKSFWFDVYFGGTEKAPGSLSFDFDSLVLSSERIGCGDNPIGTFRDIGTNVHKDNIGKLAHAGITRGCNPPLNDLYCPDKSVTRGQMAAFLVRALGLPSSSVDFFTDDADSVFQADINALAASGITRGCSDTEFCPNRAVTRGQMAAFLDRALDLPATTPDWFADDDDSIFEPSIDRLAASGITSGCNPPANTNYCADKKVTRAQMASFLSRALNLPSPPPPPPGYTPPVVPAGYDAVVPVGWSIQEVADSQPTGARILLRAGTHLRQQVEPRSAQQFIGEPGTIMDGLGETAFAFTGSANNVTVRGIEIKDYTAGFDKGAIHVEGTGWRIEQVEVRDSSYVGVSIGGNSSVVDSFIHHNDQYGILVDGGTGAVIDGNEISHNNDDQPTGDDDYYFAGAKFIATTDLTVTNNHVHDNHGYGFWTYTDNIGTLYKGNLIERNYWTGIRHYRSYSVTITDNDFVGNGTEAIPAPGDRLKYAAAQISGPNATVTNNTVTGNYNAIVVIGKGLGGLSGAHGPLAPVNTRVIGNTVIGSGHTGLYGTDGVDAVLDTAEFDNNDYQQPDVAERYWMWDLATLDWVGWQDFDQDLNGSLAPL